MLFKTINSHKREPAGGLAIVQVGPPCDSLAAEINALAEWVSCCGYYCVVKSGNIVQAPEEKAMVVLLMPGKPGCGKGIKTFARM